MEVPLGQSRCRQLVRVVGRRRISCGHDSALLLGQVESTSITSSDFHYTPIPPHTPSHIGLAGVLGKWCACAEIRVATQRVATVRQLNQQRGQVGVHHGQVSRSGITKAVGNAVPVDASQQPLAGGAFQEEVYQRPRRIGITAVIGTQRGQKFRAEQVINEGLPETVQDASR